MRTRLAAARVFADEVTYRGLLDCIQHTYRTSGARGFYAGCGASCLEIAPYSAIAFGAYEGLKQRGEAPLWRVGAGVASGVCATTACYPLDTVRRQLMLDGALGFQSRYQGSILRCVGYTWAQGRRRWRPVRLLDDTGIPIKSIDPGKPI